MKKNKILIIFLILCMAFGVSSCENTQAKGEKLAISTNEYPVYDFLKKVFNSSLQLSLVDDENNETAKKSDMFITITSNSFGDNIFELKKEVVLPNGDIWLSPKKATDVFCAVYNKVISMDKRFENKFKNKYEDYILSLQNIDAKMKELNKEKTIILSHEYDLSILEADYGLKTKMLNEKTGSVVGIADSMKKENIGAVYYIRDYDDHIAKVTANMVNAHSLMLESGKLKNVSDIKNAPSYIKMLENNLENLSKR